MSLAIFVRIHKWLITNHHDERRAFGLRFEEGAHARANRCANSPLPVRVFNDLQGQ